ncbi:hypothetical protein KY345_06360, partial [Candidatus Woesearchaeota archaeon]|nr:hypothetical protein [Candidatus Woesearchaeota archaeon]
SSTAFRRLNTYDKIALIVDFLERFDYSKRAAKASKDIIADARKTIDMLVRYGSLSPEKSEERKP